MEEAASRIIVALDFQTLDEAQRVVNMYKGLVGGFKAAQTLLTAEGAPRVAEALAGTADIIFGDFKYHDIPFQVEGSVKAATKLGFNMINVHAAGGSKMMLAAMRGAYNGAEEVGIKVPTIIAVTALTSLNFDDLVEAGELEALPSIADPVEREELQKRAIERLVRNRALLAQDCNLDGVVASPLELLDLRQNIQPESKIITPGIRLPGSSVDDQSRLSTPEFAIANGSNYLVVGRDFTGAEDPPSKLTEYCKRIIGAISN